jgi:glutamyl-Q tRNA(Asp) synthetase
VDPAQPTVVLEQVLEILGQRPPRELHRTSLRECWEWAIAHWDLTKVPRRKAVPIGHPGHSNERNSTAEPTRA